MKVVKHDLKAASSVQRSKLEELIITAQATLFSSLFLQNKDAEDGRLFSLFSYAITALQWLAFPLSTSLAFPWDREGHWAIGSINVLFDVLSGTTIDSSVSNPVYVTSFFAILSWTLLTLGLNALVLWKAYQREHIGRWIVKVCRKLTVMARSFMFFPIVGTLFRSMRCGAQADGRWHGSNYACGGAAHVTFAVCAGMLLAAIIPLCLLSSALSIDRNPVSSSLTAVVSGRNDVMASCFKLSLSFLYNVLPGAISVNLLMLYLALIAFVRCRTVWNTLPYVVPWVNNLVFGIDGSFAWAVLCLILAQVTASDTGSAVVFGMPACIACCIALCHSRTVFVSKLPLDAVKPRPWQILDFWARSRLREYDGAKSSVASLDALSFRGRQHLSGSKAADLFVGKENEMQDERVRRPTTYSLDGTGVNRLASLRESTIEAAEAAYDYGMHRHSKSALFLTAAAAFYRLHHKRFCLQVSLLRRAHAEGDASGAVDAKYFVYCQTRSLQERVSGGDTEAYAPIGASKVDRIAFERVWQECDETRTLYFKSYAKMFNMLAEVSADAKAIEDIGHLVANYRTRVVRLYESLLHINPSSSKALRAFGEFMEDVLFDSDAANEMEARAQRIEESHEEAKVLSLSDVQVGCVVDIPVEMDELNGMIIVSGDSDRLGAVVSVNSKALSFLAMQRVALIDRYVSCIFPGRLGDWVLSQLSDVLRTDDCDILDRSVLVPLLTGNGSVATALMSVREHPPEAPGGEPLFVVVLKPIRLREEFFVVEVDTNARDYRVLTGSSPLLQCIPIDPGEFLNAHAKPRLSQWVKLDQARYNRHTLAELAQPGYWADKRSSGVGVNAMRLRRGQQPHKTLLSAVLELRAGAASDISDATFEVAFGQRRFGGSVHSLESLKFCDGMYVLPFQHIAPSRRKSAAANPRSSLVTFSKANLTESRGSVVCPQPDAAAQYAAMLEDPPEPPSESAVESENDAASVDMNPKVTVPHPSVGWRLGTVSPVGGEDVGANSVSSSVFSRYVRQFRRQVTEANDKRRDLSAMARLVKVLVLVMILGSVSVSIAYSSFGTYLHSRSRLVYSELDLARSLRMCVTSLRAVTLVNEGYSAFGPLDLRVAETASYITQVQAAFDFASDETITVTTQSVLDNWWARDVMQQESRTDGSVVMFPFNRPEAVERFLVNLRNLMKREPRTWTRNDSEVNDIISDAQFHLTKALNSTADITLDLLATNLVRAQSVSLVAFVSAFLLMSAVIVFQFLVSIRSLAYKNLRVLTAVMVVPIADLRKMKSKADELLHKQLGGEAGDAGFGVDGFSDGGDHDANDKRRKKHGRQRTSVVDTTNFVTGSALRLSVPLVLVMLWFVGLYVAQTVMTKSIWSLTAQSYLTQQEALSSSVVFDNILVPVEAEMPERSSLLQVPKAEITMLQKRFQWLTEGSTLLGLAFTGANRGSYLELTTGDACAEYAQTTQAYAACASYLNGTFTHGLYYSIIHYVDVANTVLNQIPLDATNSSVILQNVDFLSTWSQLLTLQVPYLRNISSFMAHRLLVDLEATITATEHTQTVMSVVFVVGFTLFAFLYYIPSIQGVANRVMLTQSLLFAFPNDLLGTVPSLRNEIHAIILRERSLNAEDVALSPKHSQNVVGASRKVIMLKETKKPKSVVGKAVDWFTHSFKRPSKANPAAVAPIHATTAG